ncbi:MAG: nucleotide exchange factor GrpE [Bacteroidales bacterium]|nr:nucleotide exchange factor GrpE [Bacteroidales bacterium]
MNTQEEKLEEQQKPEQDVQTDTTEAQAQEQPADDVKEVTPEEQIEELQKQLAAQKDAYLRLMADFDNFRKNTLRDKQNLLKYGGEDAFKKLLPVIDDFERAIDHMEKSDDINSLREGVNLIYSKFKTYLEQNELTVIPAEMGETFDENIHDAMTLFPAPTPELKGKVVDCVTKGYKLKDKVIRFAKVVVGQ